MFVFCTRNGGLYRDGAVLCFGYSGHAQGRNEPQFESVRNVGPVPRGEWEIIGPPIDTPAHGHYVLRLVARRSTESFGRSGFLVHGDSLRAPGSASEGCIILPLHIRRLLWESGDTSLLVVGEAPAALPHEGET